MISGNFLIKFLVQDLLIFKIVTGDFNSPCVDCSTGSPTNVDNFNETFCEILDDHFLTQTNLYITRPNVTN